MSDDPFGATQERSAPAKLTEPIWVPGKHGKNYLAVRDCSRCGGRDSHPLEAGWKIDAFSEGVMLHVGPCCARDGDLDRSGE